MFVFALVAVATAVVEVVHAGSVVLSRKEENLLPSDVRRPVFHHVFAEIVLPAEVRQVRFDELNRVDDA